MNNLTIKNKLCFSEEEIKTLEKNIQPQSGDKALWAGKISKKELNKFNDYYYNKLISYIDNLRIIQLQANINFQVIEI